MIRVTELAIRRGARLLFENAGFSIYPGQKFGLVGANGSGKSSLFALISGELSPDQGEMNIPGPWVIARVEQETELSERAAIDYVIDGDPELRQLEARLHIAESNQDAMEIAACHERLLEIDGYHATSRAARLMAGLGFENDQIELPMKQFSGGWIMRLNLGKAVMCRSDLLLLDEPTNHLDLDAVIWLESWLKRYPGTLLLISHDRDFLDAVVQHIVHIEDQRIHHYKGNYSAFELQRVERLSLQQASYQKQQQAIAHMQRYIDRFRYKASKARQAQSRIKAMERMQQIAPAHVDSPFRFEFREVTSLPTVLIRLDRVSVGYDDRQVLQKVDFSLLPGARIGLLGLNGAGKSTLIKLLAAVLEPMQGEVIRAADLRVGYFAQHQVELLDLEASPLLAMQRLDGKLSEREIRGYLGGFNFSGDKVLQPVRLFSGGEKARLVLALIIWQRPNLLLLDEPTNHLDVEMRLALNQALQGFEGSVILVSHDRHLLRSVCAELWLVDGGQVAEFEGDLDDYPDWLAKRKSLPGDPRLRDKKPADRKQLKSKMNRRDRLEKEINRMSEQRTRIEDRLGEEAMYRDDNKQQLQALLQQQAEISSQLDAAEEQWLELCEAIEAELA